MKLFVISKTEQKDKKLFWSGL